MPAHVGAEDHLPDHGLHGVLRVLLEDLADPVPLQQLERDLHVVRLVGARGRLPVVRMARRLDPPVGVAGVRQVVAERRHDGRQLLVGEQLVHQPRPRQHRVQELRHVAHVPPRVVRVVRVAVHLRDVQGSQTSRPFLEISSSFASAQICHRISKKSASSRRTRRSVPVLPPGQPSGDDVGAAAAPLALRGGGRGGLGLRLGRLRLALDRGLGVGVGGKVGIDLLLRVAFGLGRRSREAARRRGSGAHAVDGGMRGGGGRRGANKRLVGLCWTNGVIAGETHVVLVYERIPTCGVRRKIHFRNPYRAEYL